MKKFLVKLTYFLLIPIGYTVFYYSFPTDRYKLVDYTLVAKMASLEIDEEQTNVIIAGDSRAERHLIPRIISEQTGLSAINVAICRTDLVTTVTALKERYNLDSRKIFVISISSYQINDGAVDHGYLSLVSFDEMTLFEKIHLCRRRLSEFVRLQNQVFISQFQRQEAMVDTTYHRESGYLEMDGVLNTTEDVSRLIKSHDWYKNMHNNGVRWSIFRKSLQEIGETNSLFILYQPPVSRFWRLRTSGSFIDSAEREFSMKVRCEAEKYKNIVFLDFYTNETRSLSDSMYYDIQHLNRKGAEVFSTLLSQKITEVYHADLRSNDSTMMSYDFR